MVDKRFRKARIWSNVELRKIAHHFCGDVINVSGRRDSDKQGDLYRNYFSNAKSYSITNYGAELSKDSSSEINLDLTKSIPAEYRRKYDVVFNHTTFEHIYEVRKAFNNLCELSRDIVIVIVPFSQVYHRSDDFDDYWRFTPSAINMMFAESNMRVLFSKSNNDRNCAIYTMFVATRNYDKWKNVIDSRADTKVVGDVIGRGIFRSSLRGIKDGVRRLFSANID